MPASGFCHTEKGKTEQALSMQHKKAQPGENKGSAVILKEEQIRMLSIDTLCLLYVPSSWADKKMNKYFIFKLTIYSTEYMKTMLILPNFIVKAMIKIVT